MQFFELNDKTVLITGAASGLGEHFSSLFSKAGARVVASARKLSQLKKLESTVSRIVPLEMNIASKESVSQAFAILEEAGEKIDILVHCAGVIDYTPLFESNVSDDFERIIQTNLLGTWYITQAVAMHMKKYATNGSIIYIGSVSGDARPAKSGSGYCISKSAVMHLTKTLVGELSPHNIRINAISTWMIPTPMTDATIKSEGDKIVAMTPLGLAKLDDIDGAVLFLASNKASRYATGSCVTVDGGVSWGGIT